MTALVGIHGISNQQAGRNQLLSSWRPALQDGIERASGHGVGEPPLDIAFYGDVFLSPKTTSTNSLKAGGADPWSDINEEEARFLTEAARELLTEQEISDAEQTSSKGHLQAPLWLQALLRALDKHSGAGSAALWFFDLRQVRRYLTQQDLKETVDQAVERELSGDCRVLIGHSLGSVVAFEYVRTHPEHHLDLLLTLGSPLALKAVRRLMPDPDHGAAAGLPKNVAAWENIRDQRDPVTCAGDLRPWWPGITEAPPVNNGGNAHSVERYLSKRETGAALLQVLPDLGRRQP